MATYDVRTLPTESEKASLSSYPELLQEMLIARGIKTKEEAEAFLNPDYDAHSHDPFLIKGMDRAVGRILTAIDGNERIVIYSDYDCDGIPGGVVLHDFFKKIGYSHFENYIPHRHEEGYGLNLSAIESCAERGATLMVTVDCGITDVVPVSRANELGLDVIITDHHLPNGELPSAYVILNSKQDGDTYPDNMLCGAGVAFKLVQALVRSMRAHGHASVANLPVGFEKWFLDMAGLSTMADMVPLRNENRVLAHYGLKVLRKSRRLGLQALCKKTKIDQRYLSEDDIGFMIAPRINAASRMGHPFDAFELLATNDPVRAGMLGEHLHKINDERKWIVASMVKDVKKRIERKEALREVIVIGDPRWRPALLGLVANSLVESYERPVFVWGREAISTPAQDSTLKGSCRSDGSVDLVELMGEKREIFVDFGGHKFSGGFSVANDRIHTLEEHLIEAYKKVKASVVDGEKIMIDRELSIDDVSRETYRLIERLAPFGEGNPKPLFLFRGVPIAGVKHFGKEKNHLELQFSNFEERVISAIGFFMTADRFNKRLEAGERIDLVATIEESRFRGRPELRLRIVDIM